MTARRFGAALALGTAFFVCLSVGALRADVKTEQKTLVKFEGMLGRMMGLFGGKAAREGVVSTVGVKGDRKFTSDGNSGQIIDLNEEKVYDLDIRDKSYKVTTFAEMRRRMEEAAKRAEESARQAEPETKEARKEDRPQAEVEFSLKDTGQRKTINGHACREVVMTITVREKGKTLEQSGGIVMTTNSWLTPEIKAVDEIAEFDRRYAEKLEGVSFGASAEQMAAALAMYPLMKQAFAKFEAENVNMEGTAIQTTMTLETVKGAEQMASEEKAKADQPSASGGVGGLLGGLGRRVARKKAEGDPKTRSTFMTSTHEILKVSGEVGASDVAIPAGFRQK